MSASQSSTNGAAGGDLPRKGRQAPRVLESTRPLKKPKHASCFPPPTSGPTLLPNRFRRVIPSHDERFGIRKWIYLINAKGSLKDTKFGLELSVDSYRKFYIDEEVILNEEREVLTIHNGQLAWEKRSQYLDVADTGPITPKDRWRLVRSRRGGFRIINAKDEKNLVCVSTKGKVSAVDTSSFMWHENAIWYVREC